MEGRIPTGPWDNPVDVWHPNESDLVYVREEDVTLDLAYLMRYRTTQGLSKTLKEILEARPAFIDFLMERAREGTAFYYGLLLIYDQHEKEIKFALVEKDKRQAMKGCSNRRKHAASLELSCGERVKQLRVERGFTQAELADAVGVCQQVIQKVEGGRLRLSRRLAKRLCPYLAVSYQELIRGNKEAKQRGGEVSAGERTGDGSGDMQRQGSGNSSGPYQELSGDEIDWDSNDEEHEIHPLDCRAV